LSSSHLASCDTIVKTIPCLVRTVQKCHKSLITKALGARKMSFFHKSKSHWFRFFVRFLTVKIGNFLLKNFVSWLSGWNLLERFIYLLQAASSSQTSKFFHNSLLFFLCGKLFAPRSLFFTTLTISSRRKYIFSNHVWILFILGRGHDRAFWNYNRP